MLGTNTRRSARKEAALRPYTRRTIPAMLYLLLFCLSMPPMAGAIKGNWWWVASTDIPFSDRLNGTGYFFGSYDPSKVPDGTACRIYKYGLGSSCFTVVAHLNPTMQRTEISGGYNESMSGYNGWNLSPPWGYYGPVVGFISNDVGTVVGTIASGADHPFMTAFHQDSNLVVRTLGVTWVDYVVLFPEKNETQRPPKAGVGEPINVINGNMMLDETDFAIPGRPLALAFSRHYNSIDATSGPLGQGWSHNYQVFLSSTNTVLPNGLTNSWKMLHAGNGCCYWFKEVSSNTFAHCPDNDWRLIGTNAQYRVQLGQGLHYVFDTNGVLQAVADDWGGSLTLAYANHALDQLLTNVTDSAGRSLYFTYTGNQLARVGVAQTNLYVDYGYNGSGQLTGAVTHAGSDAFVRAYAYDAAASVLTQKVDEAGQATTWTYEAGSNGVLTARGTGSLVAGQYYDTRIQLDAVGNQGKCALVTNTLEGTRRIYKYVYDDVTKRLLSIQGPNSNNTWIIGNAGSYYMYDGQGNIVQEKEIADATGQLDQENTILQRQFDDCHNVTNQAFAYNAEPTNGWHYTWDTNFNVLTSVEDPEGYRIEMTYTQALPTSFRVLAGGTSFDTMFGYDTNGWLMAATNANGHGVGYEYDAQGNVIAVMPPTGPAIHYAYDTLGRVSAINLPGAGGDRTTALQRDELGRVTQIVYPNAQTNSFSYDALGNLTNCTDTAGPSTRYAWLPTRKLAAVTRTLTGATNQEAVIHYDYNTQLETLVIRDELDRHVESYGLDLQGRPVTVTNLEGQVLRATYGVGAWVKSIIHFDGTTVSNAYDGEGRLAVSLGPDFTNRVSYLRNGQIKTMAGAQGVISNTFDAAGRLAAVAQPVPQGTVNYGYRPAGQVTSVDSVAGSTSYAYDEAERLTGIQHPVAGSFAYAYNTHNGLAASMTGSNTGLNAAYAYDMLDRLTNISWKNTSGDTLGSFAYAYDAAGMITQKVSNINGQTTAAHYAYDSLNRLTAETQIDPLNLQPAASSSYTYDLSGNRTLKQVSGPGGVLATVNYAPGSGNRLDGWTVAEAQPTGRVDVAGSSSESIGTNDAFGQLWVGSGSTNRPQVAGTNFWAYGVETGSGSQPIVAAIRDAAGNVGRATNTVNLLVVTNASYVYNAAGCLTSLTYRAGGASRSYGLQWDGAYQLTMVSSNAVAVERHGYDALGRRVWTAAGGATNFFIYDGAHIVAEVDGAGALQRSYVHGPGVDNLLAMTSYGSTTNTYTYLTDHLGTVHAIADAAGRIVEQYRYDAWGRTTVYEGNGAPLAQSALGNCFAWQGREISWSTGLYYFRARWYDPVTGRWLSNDPIGISGGLNQYVFCANNPICFVDPMGLCRHDFYDSYITPSSWFDWYIRRPLQNRSHILELIREESGIAAAVDWLNSNIPCWQLAMVFLPGPKSPTKAPIYTQLEFPFARGASVQTPGVTIAGESFVRLGANPQNLRFTFETPGGVQPGTYAFPASTFNAISRDPVALQNLGDLPGAVPQYFRILEPPAGTPIQRGIVPGGQYGGVGGVEEVIFPGGY